MLRSSNKQNDCKKKSGLMYCPGINSKFRQAFELSFGWKETQQEVVATPLI